MRERKEKEIEKFQRVWRISSTSMGNRQITAADDMSDDEAVYQASEQVKNVSDHIQSREGSSRTRAESLYNPPDPSPSRPFDAIAQTGEDDDASRLGVGSTSIHRTGPKPVWWIVLMLCGIFVSLCVALGVRCRLDSICSLTR